MFWRKFVGQNDGGQFITGRCGWTHMPPNTVAHYDYNNNTPANSDIEDWNPDNTGQKKPVSATTFGGVTYNWPAPGPNEQIEQKTESQWYVYWMQNMPGRGNSIAFGANRMTNWWHFTGDWDAALRARLGLYEPGNCPVSLSASSSTVVASGGGGIVDVNARCKWIASSNAEWIRLTGSTGGDGYGQVLFNITANQSSAPRTGTIAIAGQIFTITQSSPGSNTPPTITVVGPITRQQGSPGAVSAIATVSDAETPAGNLTVTAGSVPAGITITSIANNNGAISANIAASCAAAVGASAITLTVTDGGGLTASGALTVNVTGNTPPSLGAYPSGAVVPGGTVSVQPSAPPNDNGSIASMTASAPGFSGSFSVNIATGVVTISNAGPPGDYTVTVTATDNCGASSTTSFSLKVDPNSTPTAYEADVAPRANGDGSIVSADWEQAGRFVVKLDTPAEGSEFQRADCAPRGDLGDGKITLADWAQAGRYAAGFDPKTPASGPVKATTTFTAEDAAYAYGAVARALRIGAATFQRGQVNTLQIEMDAQGDENAVAFTLNYDPALMGFSEAVLSQGGQGLSEAKLYVNTARTANGQIGVAFALPPGKVIPPGTARILALRFIPTGGANDAITKIGFGDQFVKSEVVDAQAGALTGTAFSEGVVLVTGRAVASVSAADYSGPMLAAESIVAAFGAELATTTEVAKTLPLPTTLAGVTVKVKDGKGVEHQAPLFFVSPQQVNYQIPAGTAEGIANVTITSASGAVSSGLIEVKPVKPSLFSAEASGRGLAVGYVVRVKPDGSQIIEPIVRFDAATNKFVSAPIDLSFEADQLFLALFGTGVKNLKSLAGVKVVIGGADCQVQYAGAQGDFVGLDQINVFLPRGLAGRGEVDVVLSVDSQMANVVKIHVK